MNDFMDRFQHKYQFWERVERKEWSIDTITPWTAGLMADRRGNTVAGLRVAYVTANAFEPVDPAQEATAKDAVVDLLFECHDLFGAKLHAYSVMRRHIRFMSVLPKAHDAESFGNLVRLSFADRIQLVLEAESTEESCVGTDALDSALWKRGFGHVGVDSESFFWRKIISIHMDAVRAELVHEPEEYRWSSAALFAAGMWSAEVGLVRAREDWAAIQAPYLPPIPRRC